MTDPIIQTAENQITCTICFDIFEEPKALPCLHTFCKKCIADHILHHSEFARRMGYHCPICRQFVLAPSGREFSPHLWVEALPSNHNIVSMISAYTTPRPYYLNPCSVHPNKELEFYCVDHEEYICSLCSLQHRKCDEVLAREDVDNVPTRKVAQSSESDEERYISHLFDQCNDIEHLIDGRKGILNRINQSEEEIKSRITTTSRKATELIKTQEEKVVDELNKLKSKEVHKIEADIRKCQKINDRCKKSLQRLQEARDTDDSEQMRITLDSVKQEYEANAKKIRDLSKKNFRTTMDFHINPTIDKFTSDFTSFGSVEFIRDDGIPQTPSSVSFDAVHMPTQSQRFPRPSKSATSRRRDFSPTSSCPSIATGDRDDRPRSMQSQRLRSALSADYSEHQNSGNFHTSEDTHLEVSQQSKLPCWITGIAVLDNGYFVVVDHVNENVMLYDTTYVKVSEIQVKPAPYDIVSISSTELLLTRPEVDNLLAINVYGQGELKYGTSFQTGFKAKSISHDNNHLVICSHNKLQIYIKHNGRWRKHDEHAFDRTKFTYVAIDGIKERIFITDQKYPDPELICLSYDGDIRWRFVHADLGFPTGVAICCGHIYVTSWDKGSVLRVGYDGSYEGTGIQRGIQFPWKLSVTARHDRLMLSQHKNTLSHEARRIIRFFYLDAEM